MSDLFDKLNEIKLIQKDLKCPNITYINRTETIAKSLSDQFYNPVLHQALSCIINNTTVIEKFIKSNEHLIQIRSSLLDYNDPDFECQNRLLINDVYIGIKYLNLLRTNTLGFKYVYSLSNCDQTNICQKKGRYYELEENLMPGMYLSEYLSKNQDLIILKAIIFQIILNINYATKIKIKNVDSYDSIYLRQVDSNSIYPVYFNDGIKYYRTYGYIPVFTDFSNFEYTVNPINISYEEIIKSIFKMSNRPTDNIKLYLSESYYDELFVNESTLSNYKKIFSDNIFVGAPAYTIDMIINKLSLPFNFLYAYVQSLVNRLDFLIYLYDQNYNDLDNQFIIYPGIIKYKELLLNEYNKYEPELRNRIFLPSRENRYARSNNRFMPGTKTYIKSDIEFINSIDLDKTRYKYDDNIRVKISQIKKKILIVIRESNDLENRIFNLNSRDQILNSIDLLHKLLCYRNYLEISISILNYAQYPSDPDIINTLDMLNKLYIKYNQCINEYRASSSNINDQVIRSIDDAIFLQLYSIYISSLPPILSDYQKDEQYITTINKYELFSYDPYISDI